MCCRVCCSGLLRVLKCAVECHVVQHTIRVNLQQLCALACQSKGQDPTQICWKRRSTAKTSNTSDGQLPQVKSRNTQERRHPLSSMCSTLTTDQPSRPCGSRDIQRIHPSQRNVAHGSLLHMMMALSITPVSKRLLSKRVSLLTSVQCLDNVPVAICCL